MLYMNHVIQHIDTLPRLLAGEVVAYFLGGQYSGGQFSRVAYFPVAHFLVAHFLVAYILSTLNFINFHDFAKSTEIFKIVEVRRIYKG